MISVNYVGYYRRGSVDTESHLMGVWEFMMPTAGLPGVPLIWIQDPLDTSGRTGQIKGGREWR